MEIYNGSGGYTSDSETSSAGERNTAMGDKQIKSPNTRGYRSSDSSDSSDTSDNGKDSGIDNPEKVWGEKNGGYNTSDSEASTTATETNVIDGPKKVCRRFRNRKT